ncbi:SagB/ThcOx family dehydrogenase [Streptomyces sp. NPDC093514]|uniref:SagB/ThcOx family dehydrogenase n=1 Tax=Streptomyces sp. NPDC093514 TaxID=3366039 RepID=UPI003829BCD2
MTMDIRSSPAISVIAAGDRVVIWNSDDRAEFSVPDDEIGPVASVLADCAKWQPLSTASAHVADVLGVSARRAEDTLLDLAQRGFFQTRTPDENVRPFDEPETWTSYGWRDAYLYHRHIRSLPTPEYSTRAGFEQDVEEMRAIVAEEAQPSAYLDRAALRSVELDRPPAGAPRPGVLSDTVTTEAPLAGRIEPADLEWLMHLSFGKTGTRRLPVTGDHIVKTSPSGGSRHPTEVYPVVLPGTHLEPGVYHYNVREHRLDLLRAGDLTDFVRRHVIILRNRPNFRPRIAFILASVVDRSMYRYRESRSYRVLYQDAGHLLQTFAYAGSSLGRSTYRGYTMHTTEVANLLGIDELEQVPLAYGVLG